MIRAIVIFCILLVSCSQKKDNITIRYENGTTLLSGIAMTMNFRITVGKNLSNEECALVTEVINSTFDQINHIHNKWNPRSEVSDLNNLDAGQIADISPSMFELLQQTDQAYKITQGRFDPTIEPLQRLWKKNLVLNTKPSNEEIQAIKNTIGWDKIQFNANTFSKKASGVELDFGGIAKGYCIDLIVERLLNKGFEDIYVEWGGEISARGKHPEGRPWTVYISKFGDSDPEQALATVPLINQAIATSGDYLQNWSLREGKTVIYFHIFDPIAMKPLEASHCSVASASVIANSCAFADALATAAMMFPSVLEAEAWLESVKEQYPEISFRIASRNLCTSD